MLESHNGVDVVLALDAVVEAGEQAVGIRGQVHAHHVCLLVGDVVQETGVLMGKAVVVLLPYIGGQNQVQRSDLLSPW